MASTQQLCHTLPAVFHSIKLLEVVLAAICRQLQLRPWMMVHLMSHCWYASSLHAATVKGPGVPPRYRAPLRLASVMEAMTLSRLPPKSSAHWLRLQVARVARRLLVLHLSSSPPSEPSHHADAHCKQANDDIIHIDRGPLHLLPA